MCLLLFFFLNNCVDLTSAGLNSASKGSGNQEVSYINKDDFSSFISFILFLFFAFVEEKQSTREKKNFGEKYNLGLQESDRKMYNLKRIKLQKRDAFAFEFLQYQEI